MKRQMHATKSKQLMWKGYALHDPNYKASHKGTAKEAVRS